MASRIIKALSTLDLEERILNAASVIAVAGMFMPWLSGEWLGGDPVTYSGMQFYTSFLGLAVLLLHLATLAVTVVPLVGGPVVVKKRYREILRLSTTGQATILILASLSVLTKVTFEFSRMEVRFGVYCTLIGSLVATLYSWLKVQELRRSEQHETFHHPEDHMPIASIETPVMAAPPPPPPPPPLQPEEYHARP